MSGLTDQDARALTHLAGRIRKETHGCREWDDAGTYAVIAELIGHNLALTAERVIRHAADREAKTPGAIKRPFLPDAPVTGPPRPPKPSEACRLCGRNMHAPDAVCDEPTSRPLASVPPPPTYLDARRRPMQGA